MARYKLVADFLRRKRTERGFRSAAQLARAAGLAGGHIATFERGEVRPRPQTAKRIASALRLTVEERAELFRLIALDGAPTELSGALASPVIPGLPTWSHLPRLLLEIPHADPIDLVGPPPFEAIVADALRAAAALLGWLAALATLPRGRTRAEFLERLERSAKGLPRVLGRFYEGDERAEQFDRALTALPHVWKGHVFGQQRSAARAVRQLKAWTYSVPPALSPGSRFVILGFQLRSPPVQAAHGIDVAEARAIVAVYDAMLTFRLWRDLGLAEVYGGSPASVPDCLRAIDDVLRLGTISPDQLRQHLQSLYALGFPPQIPFTLHPFTSAYCQAQRGVLNYRLVARLFALPEFATLLVTYNSEEQLRVCAELVHPPTPEGVIEHADRLAAVIGEFPPKQAP